MQVHALMRVLKCSSFFLKINNFQPIKLSHRYKMNTQISKLQKCAKKD